MRYNVGDEIRDVVSYKGEGKIIECFNNYTEFLNSIGSSDKNKPGCSKFIVNPSTDKIIVNEVLYLVEWNDDKSIALYCEGRLIKYYSVDNPTTHTFTIENKSHKYKEAILCGSLINLDGELDDDYVEIILCESSHKALKRALLSTSMLLRVITISNEKFNDYHFERVLEYKHNETYGTIIRKKRRFEGNKIFFNGRLLNKHSSLIFNVPPKSSFTATLYSEKYKEGNIN